MATTVLVPDRMIEIGETGCDVPVDRVAHLIRSRGAWGAGSPRRGR